MLLDRPVRDFLEDLAAGSGAPGAGSAAAMAGAMAAAIVSMVCRVTLGSDKHAEAHEKVRGSLVIADDLRGELAALAEKDAEVYRGFAEALKLSRGTEAEKQLRKEAIQSALRLSTETPLEIARKCRVVLEAALPAAGYGAPMAVADVAGAVMLAEAGREAAVYAARGNLSLIKDAEYVRRVEAQLAEIEDGIEDLRRRALLLAESRIG